MDISKLIDQVKEKGQDQTQAKKGSDLPPVGTARLRLVEYIELGKQKHTFKGDEKESLRVHCAFELSGKDYPPIDTDDGPRPRVISQTFTLSMSDKAQFFKVFSRMRAGTDAKHIIELTGDRAAFLGQIVHNKSGDKTYANIDFDTLRPAYLEQLAEDGETVIKTPLNVTAALTKPLLFVWQFATPEMWDALYIPGEWEERKDDKGNVTAPAQSKNKWQEIIRKALNFSSLPCHEYAAGAVSKESAEALTEAVGDVVTSKPAAKVDSDDLMVGIA